MRVEIDAGLNRDHRNRRGLCSVGAVIQRLVRGIEVEFGAEPRELIVAGGFEDRRHVLPRGQPAAEAGGGNRDMVALGGVVEVGDAVRAVGYLLESKAVVAGSAGQDMAAGIAEQDVVAAAAVSASVPLVAMMTSSPLVPVSVVAVVALLMSVSVALLALTAMPSDAV